MEKYSRFKSSFKVLELLLNHEMSRAEIADLTGLTRTTVGNIVKTFIDYGFVKEEKTVSSNVGRRPVPLGIVSSFINVIGIGISRHRIEGCLTNASGEIFAHETYPSSNESKTEQLIKNIMHVINKLLLEASHESLEVKAIGIGVPAPLDPVKGIVINPPKFPNFKNVPLVHLLSNNYKARIWIENDANMAALGEKRYGGGRDLNNFICIHTSEGIGAGIIINSQIYRGEMGYSGEIGHSLIEQNGILKYFEDVYGADIIVNEAKSHISKDISSINDISDAYKSGNKDAKYLIEQISIHMGALILSLIHVSGISNIFIGGKYQAFGETLICNVRKIISEYAFTNQMVNIHFSHLGTMSIPMGAAAHAIDMYLKNLILDNKYKMTRLTI